jgi:hypothetical protein
MIDMIDSRVEETFTRGTTRIGSLSEKGRTSSLQDTVTGNDYDQERLYMIETTSEKGD